MNKKLVEVGSAVVALLVLAIIFIIGAVAAGPENAHYLYLSGILVFMGALILFGRKVSEPVV